MQQPVSQSVPQKFSNKLFSKTLLLSLSFSFIVIAVLYLFFVRSEHCCQPFRISLIPLFAAIALTLLTHLCGGLRLQLLSRYSGEKLSLWQGVKAHLLGLFCAAITPSGSGHIPMLSLSLVKSAVPKHTAWSVGFYSGIIDMFSYAWMLPVAAIILLLNRSSVVSADAGLLAVIFVISLLLFIGFYLLVMKLRYLETVIVFLCERSFLRRWLRPWQERILGSSKKLIARMDHLSGQPFHRHVYLQFVSSIMHIAGYCILWVVLVGVGIILPFFETVALTFLILILSFVIPTPGGSGYAEASASLIVGYGQGYLHGYGQAMSLVLPAIILWRFLIHYLNLIIGSFLGGHLLLEHLNEHKESQ